MSAHVLSYAHSDVSLTRVQGYYDHVSPPSKGVPAPEPDMVTSPFIPDFRFDRLGIRVPLLVVSPYIPRGVVVSEPPAAQRPFPTSRYEHTSMMATARKLLGVKGSLTRRDAWAATFEHVLSLAQPRATPLHTPAPPPRDPAALQRCVPAVPTRARSAD